MQFVILKEKKMHVKYFTHCWLFSLVIGYVIWIASADHSSENALRTRFNQDSSHNFQASVPKLKRRRVKRPKEFQLKTTNISPKESRLLSIFTVVQFNNNDCRTKNGENGTCITSSECALRGGIAGGTCAKEFGICCIFMATCGQTTSQNRTYFVNPHYPSPYDGTGSCQLTLKKGHPDVCQYRIDFDQFKLAGPETTNNVCNNDQFIVSGGNPIPAICGSSDGNHMYINAGTGPTNPIVLTVVTSGPSFHRNWKMRISQIPCSSTYRAEEGCLQYFTGVSGQIRSYNYDSTTGLQLSNQDYSSCIRIERNFCSIQYTACPGTAPNASAPFSLSGVTTGAEPVTSMVGAACTSDWIMIPCAMNQGRLPANPPTCVDRICGGTFNSEMSTNPAIVYSTVKPFRMVVHTDGVEAPNDMGNKGFCLNYVQLPCTNKFN